MSARAIEIAACADEHHLRALTDDALQAEAMARLLAFEAAHGWSDARRPKRRASLLPGEPWFYERTAASEPMWRAVDELRRREQEANNR